MTDFYSVLQRAVSSLPDGSGPNRRAVYDKARKALLKQLQSFDPPLPSSDVTAQRLALEDAIRKIENEIARQIRTQRALQTAMPTGKGGVRRPAAGAEGAAAPARNGEAERAAQRTADAERARQQHAAMLENAVSEATIESEPEMLRTPPVPVVARPSPEPEPQHDGDMFEEEDDYRGPSPLDETIAERDDDIVDGEYDEVEDEEEEPAAPVAAAPAVEPRAERRRANEEKRARKEEQRRLKTEQREAKRASRKSKSAPARGKRERKRTGTAIGRAVLPLVLVVLLAGAGYAAYTQREALLAVLDELQQDPAQRPPITVTGRAGVDKNTDRLPSTLDGEDTRTVTTTTWPPREAGAEGAAPEGADAAGETTTPAAPAPAADRTVGADVSPFAADPSATGAEAQAEEQVASADPAGTAGAEEPEDDEAAADATAEEAAPASQSSDTALTEFTASGTQQAVLYEEAAQAGEQGTAVAGGVEWSMVRESIGGGDPEPVIRATAEIPERDMTATITVRKNQDSALPASHLIEIAFELPEDGEVKNVPGVIMKQSEQSRGEALRGAAARVSSGLFWIALSENEVDKENNLRLLRERDWIDIPILYESGRRAILTLRKGSDGFESVNAAIQAWSPG